jgi:hypothetical protein
MLYDIIIRKLTRTRPVTSSPADLTERIMYNLDSDPVRNYRKISIRVNQRQWQLITGMRTILTTAAACFIGFFVWQQREINNKLSRLEQQVTQVSYPVAANQPDAQAQIIRVGGISYTIPKEWLPDSMPDEVLQINRKSLNYMLQRINQLEDENVSFRQKLQHFYSDTTQITPK